MLKAPDDTKVEISPSFDRNWYRVQTLLQSLLALTVVAGLLGLFGGGWLSASVVHLGNVDVTYDRFARRTVPMKVTITSTNRTATGTLRVMIERDLIEKAGVIRTIPSAISVTDNVKGTEFVFATQTEQPRIVISIQPDSWGVFTWKLNVDEGGEASLFQIIYP